MKKIIIALALALFNLLLFGQSKQWTLEDCINYGLENNYTVKRTLLEQQSKQVQLNTTAMSILPSAYAQINQNFDFGRSESANAVIVDNSQSSTSLGIGVQMPLFSGLKTYYQKSSDELNLRASIYDLAQAKENITLNITAYYLQVILNKEILQIAKEQVKLSEEQVTRIQKLVDNGKNPESELYEAKSNLASDNLSVTKANNDYELSKLDLAQLMNISDISCFELATPDDADIQQMLNNTLDISQIFENSINRPAILAAKTRIEKAHKDIMTTKSDYYPSLSLSASYGTGYYYIFQGDATINSPFGTQLSNNSREIIGLSLNIPIFNKFAVSNNVKLAQIALKNQENELEEAQRNITKEIQQAYNNALASKDQYYSSHLAVEASKTAFEYEEAKYNNGASTSYDYNQAKNKYIQAQSEEAQSKYDYILRVKILNFYMK
ncbi:MAG: TolC family protein [Bacteroidales bacterium]|nr:TolC family protein [Bacteroidales bacterium]MDD2205104.1 TolC family protein [Bacteroidales bacterium]MDD3152744.1 TolC family protein [Bacteroidales bacterium]MDD3914586.1 TolC family protein [Bacteroidales bacterium]MDD4634469.1 TolC family protein [Bacteroidales bacterium]